MKKDQNQFTKSVLDLIKNMMLFGSYQTPEDFSKSKLLKGLLKLLNGCFDVTIPEETQWLELGEHYMDSKPSLIYFNF